MARAKASGAVSQERNSSSSSSSRIAECVLNFSFVRKFHSIESRGEGVVGSRVLGYFFLCLLLSSAGINSRCSLERKVGIGRWAL